MRFKTPTDHQKIIDILLQLRFSVRPADARNTAPGIAPSMISSQPQTTNVKYSQAPEDAGNVLPKLNHTNRYTIPPPLSTLLARNPSIVPRPQSASSGTFINELDRCTTLYDQPSLHDYGANFRRPADKNLGLPSIHGRHSSRNSVGV